MVNVPWCSRCGTQWRGAPQQVVSTYSRHPVDRCPVCGNQLARNAVKTARIPGGHSGINNGISTAR